MSVNDIQIKDIYAGMPDARDEFLHDKGNNFIKAFVVDDTFNINSLINEDKCLITGYKGTGKTALLYYLDYLVKSQNAKSISSFIFFKESFTEVDRRDYEYISRRILMSVSINKEDFLNIEEFEYIWRWILLNKFVSDNKNCNYAIFDNNQNWKNFCSKLREIDSPIKNKKISLSELLFKAGNRNIELDGKFQINNNEDYKKFYQIIDDCEELFFKVSRTKVPYYIFIDELEAYFDKIEIFKRDLYLIRDLIFTVKRYNNIFISCKYKKTKIICSVRTEVINAIESHIVPKELNKTILGFAVPLIWDYDNTNSYMHPIIQILLKRIYVSEGKEEFDPKEIYEKWFPEKIHGIEAANYILNNGWCKPRDITRLIISAQHSIKSSESAFTQNVLNTVNKHYSESSLQEIQEELRATYQSREIDEIKKVFLGYKTIFSKKELIARINSNNLSQMWKENLDEIIDNLYRVGFIGSYLPSGEVYRWKHKGDENIILNDDWRIVVHRGLHNALSMAIKQDIGLNRNRELQTGDMVNVVVKDIARSFVNVEFTYKYKKLDGSIHISRVADKFILDLRDEIEIGDEKRAKVVGYNEQRKKWELSLMY